jgi:predicted Zn-dependent peptidase
VFITVPLSRETVTLNALLPAVLKRGTVKLDSQEKISIELENMYGSTFDCGIDKIGDNHVIKFYLESLNDNFIPQDVGQIEKSINLLLDILFNPLIEDEKFKEEYVNSEKNNIKQLIESRIDNKDRYALSRCTEEMYKDQTYGLYKYGYSEDLDSITSESLYSHYTQIKDRSKIDIFVSGDIKTEEVLDIVIKNENISTVPEREGKAIINNEQTEVKSENNLEPKKVEERMDVGQGKLVIGLDVKVYEKNAKFPIAIYNVILGESATSKLFQNVREKESLAYTIRSNYVRQKNNIYIKSGIEIEKYEKAIKIIKEQLEDMSKGKFTDEDLQNAKKYMESGIRTVEDEQDSEITYYIGQELAGSLTTFDEYVKRINDVTKEDVEKVANSVNINTIYFLKN